MTQTLNEVSLWGELKDEGLICILTFQQNDNKTKVPFYNKYFDFRVLLFDGAALHTANYLQNSTDF